MFDGQIIGWTLGRTVGVSKGVSTRSPRPHPKHHHFARYGAVLDRLFRRLLIRSIGFYQRRLSPYKGFSCAYRVLHGTHSCSQATQEILRDHALVEALPRIRHQFCQCRDAMHIIRDRRSQMAARSPRCRRRLATANALLFPTLSDLLSQGEEVDGYEQSRRDAKRRNTGGTGEGYRGSWCDWYDCASCSLCASAEGVDCCDVVEGCDGCVNGCA